MLSWVMLSFTSNSDFAKDIPVYTTLDIPF